ncbi:MAG TPA: BTAD domain-containing putative transcriptional regulator [Chloroflexaceae bacterium]|nr:BTAD domain-containing putative transcriptional regulator [Chloroflexaceae bacterium]
MSTLRIALFGRLKVGRAGASLRLPAKVAELLCLLLLRRGQPQTREALATTLWGEASPDQGKKYLRQTLWQLQQTLEVDQRATPLLRLEREWVAVADEADLEVDAYQLDDACVGLAGLAAAFDPDRADEAAALYCGDLLEGWYQEWCLVERERYQALYIALLERLLEHCVAQGHFAAGVSYGLQLLRLEPTRERSHQQLMRLYALSGDRGAALGQLERCRATLAREFGVGPGEATTALAARIRAGELAGGDAQQGGALADELAELRARVARLQGEVAGLKQLLSARAMPAADAPTDAPTDARMLGSPHQHGANE